ncbi:MAG: DUF1840 domain-containing protein [Pseudomonadota bacterium]
MLITFKCSAYADISYTRDIALLMLQMMGQGESVPGAILADQVAAALASLKNAVATQKESGAAPAAQQKNSYDVDDEPVSLEHRAQPLIELLNAAAKEKCNVIWENS